MALVKLANSDSQQELSGLPTNLLNKMAQLNNRNLYKSFLGESYHFVFDYFILVRTFPEDTKDELIEY
jgi:hypothetical protein